MTCSPFFPQLVQIGAYGGQYEYIVEGNITANGSGYTIGDTLTCNNGNAPVQPVVYSVTSVNGSGGVTGFNLVTQGGYVLPFPSPATFSGGSGAGFEQTFFVGAPNAVAVLGAQGGGMPNDITAATMSTWLCLTRGFGTANYYGFFGDGGNTLILKVSLTGGSLSPPTSGPLDIEVNLVLSTYFTGTLTGGVPCYNCVDDSANITNTGVNVLISWNTSSQTLQVYVNDTALAVTSGGWSSSGTMSGAVTWEFPIGVFGSAATAANGVGDLWVDGTGRDLSVTATRRYWINADLTAVNLPSNGEIGSGAIPTLFLHTTAAGHPDDFLTNSGSAGGTYSVTNYPGSLLFPDLLFEVAGVCGTTYSAAPPTGSCGAATTNSVTFNWVPDPDQEDPATYNLQYRLLGTNPWTTVTGIPDPTWTYTLSPVAPGSSWQWQVQAVYPDFGITTSFSTIVTCSAAGPPPPYATQFLSCGNGFTITQPITKMWGFDHLIGISVVGLLDGIPMPAQTVAADGSVTLPFAASNVKIGLPFTPQLQTPYLDAGQPTVQGRRKNISAVTARIEASLGVLAGANQPDGAAQQPPAIAPTWGPMTAAQVQPVPSAVPISPTYQSPAGQTVTKLVTGDMRTVVTADWQIPGQVAIQGTPGLPLNVLDCVPELLEGDTTEQTYAQREPRGGPGQPAARGPGMWMLRR